MTDELVRTNLGKWGATTQTYDEHCHAVWVIRKPFASLMWPVLEKLFGEDAGDAWADYVRLINFETYGHDYDKLFVPRSRLSELTRFTWHADISDPANQQALSAFLNEAELPCSPELAARLLKAACAGHEGLRTPQKAEHCRLALQEYFSERDFATNPSDPEWATLAKVHLSTLRAADAIASAVQGPAFKDDVSILTNLVAQLLPNSSLHVISLTFDTAFGQSSLSAVLAGYYRLYDAAYKALRTRLDRSGVVLADNSRSVVALALCDKSEMIEEAWWGAVCKELHELAGLKEVVTWHQSSIDPAADPVDFDANLKGELWKALLRGHWSGNYLNGLPCCSCGRVAVANPPDDALPSNLGDEVCSMESRGDFGFVKNIKQRLYGVSRAIDKTHKLVCPQCISLCRLQDAPAIQGTLVMRDIIRIYAPRDDAPVRLTSGVTDPLAAQLYKFELQRATLNTLIQSIETAQGQGRLIASSSLLFRFTPTPIGLSATLGLIGGVVTASIERMLPDGIVTYRLDFGIRIGAGFIPSKGMVHDTRFLPGIYSFSEFAERLNSMKRIESELAHLPDKVIVKAVLRLSQRHGFIALAKELLDSVTDLSQSARDRQSPSISLEQLLKVSADVDANAQSVLDLRNFYSNISKGGRDVDSAQ